MVSRAFSIVAVRAARVAASSFGAVQRPVDLLLLRVEPADEGVELVERVLDLGLAALEGVAELAVDRLQLGEPAAVEHQRQRAEELLDLDVAVGAVERDERVVVQACPAGSSLPGGASSTYFSPSSEDCWMAATALAGSSTSRLTEMVTSAVQSSSSSSIDSTRPTGHVGDPDAGLRHQVEHVEELHLDGVRVVADVGATGQARARRRPGSRSRRAAPPPLRPRPRRCARRITGLHRREAGQRTAAAAATAAAAEQRLSQFLVVGDAVAVQVVGTPVGVARRRTAAGRRSARRSVRGPGSSGRAPAGAAAGPRQVDPAGLGECATDDDLGVQRAEAVVAGVQRAEVGVVGARQVAQRGRRHVEHLGQLGPLLHQDQGHVGQPVDVRGQQRRVVPDEARHVAQGVAAAARPRPAGPRARRRAAR